MTELGALQICTGVCGGGGPGGGRHRFLDHSMRPPRVACPVVGHPHGPKTPKTWMGALGATDAMGYLGSVDRATPSAESRVFAVASAGSAGGPRV